jgi:hypothetical protein
MEDSPGQAFYVYPNDAADRRLTMCAEPSELNISQKVIWTAIRPQVVPSAGVGRSMHKIGYKLPIADVAC